MDCEPLKAWLPDQAPEAVHEVALVDDHFKLALSPLAIVLGLAARFTVGAGCFTDTVEDCDAVPPAPVQVSV